jgi:hypothetical protein
MASESDEDSSQAPQRLLSPSNASASSRALSFQQALLENLSLEDRLEAEASAETPEACLKRMLSVKSVISTSSSFAQRQQAAVGIGV